MWEDNCRYLILEKGRQREGEREGGSEEGRTGTPSFTVLCTKQDGVRARAVQIQWLENIFVSLDKRKRLRRKN